MKDHTKLVVGNVTYWYDEKGELKWEADELPPEHQKALVPLKMYINGIFYERNMKTGVMEIMKKPKKEIA